MHIPSAPRTNAAATPRDSTMPPVAMMPGRVLIWFDWTRSCKASIVSGTRLMMPAPRFRPCPPASVPCITKTSGSHAFEIATASDTDPTCTHTFVAPLVTRRVSVVQFTRFSISRGAKSQTAQGLYFSSNGTEIAKSAPQFMNPTPTGRTLSMGRAASLQRESACSSWEERLDWSFPEPMNPMPPLYVVVRML
jgi:hypothetical protein